MKIIVSIVTALFISLGAFSQDSPGDYHLDLGVRAKKYVGFYWENGVAAQFSSQKILHHKIQFGMSFVTSHVGTAFFSNAVPASELEVSVIKQFRHDKPLQPLLRLNTGIAFANYKSDLFSNLQQNGFLLSAEFGLSYRLPAVADRFYLKSGLGYNFFCGNGLTGLSTVYPVYGQFSVLYRLTKAPTKR